MLLRFPRNLLIRSSTRTFHNNVPLNKLTPFILADIGEGIKEVEIIQWYIKEGDTINQFDRVAEVQSDKANVEISSRYDGVVKKLHYKNGDVARVGKALIDIETDDSVQDESAPHSPNQESKPEPTTSSQSHDQDVSAMEESLEKILTTPAVRRIAREHKIDLRKVTPTGPRGRLLKEDLLNYVKHAGNVPKQEVKEIKKQIQEASAGESTDATLPPSSNTSSRSSSSSSLTRDEPVRGLKRTMIKTMNASNQIPQFGVHEEVNVDKLILMRNEFKAIAQKRGVEKLTFMPFFIKALSMGPSKSIQS
ncbi:2-oxoisovalerate dehydrogenase E2 component [Acrasis kona]|uniref:Dihydrolipoamide acetyltransferase component of pyruvate dehydrogenase complex n=1 Tax=Acrasis kona TaxID=1008807 RepID=A0AAW2YR42_9EUKA